MDGVTNFLGTLITCKVLEISDGQGGVKRELPQWTKGNFQYNWIGMLIIGVPPLMVLAGILLGVPLTDSTLTTLGIWAGLTGIIGVTAGYHRLYSHKGYTAGPFMLKLTAFMGAGSFQGSIKWWARLHRVHHKHVDTDLDPYDARRGFAFTHFGWFCMRMDYSLLGTADCSDLDACPVVNFQRKYFAILALTSGILLPWFSCGLLSGDWVGGFFYGAFLKTFIVHQLSFCINSVAHTDWFWAKQNYADDVTPHDSFIFALTNLGEGYHNYHHQFPNDYRNGYLWWHTDPTKWYIYLCSKIGFCWDLYRTPVNVIERTATENRIRQVKADLAALEEELVGRTPVVTDEWTMAEVQRLVKSEGRKLLVLDGFVLDLARPIKIEASLTHGTGEIHWYQQHPGGSAIIDAYAGKDVTAAMRGGVYKHTHGALALSQELRVATLKG